MVPGGCVDVVDPIAIELSTEASKPMRAPGQALEEYDERRHGQSARPGEQSMKSTRLRLRLSRQVTRPSSG